MKKYFELLLEYKILLYICSADVGLHLEMQSISILSIFILEAGSSDASRSHLITDGL